MSKCMYDKRDSENMPPKNAQVSPNLSCKALLPPWFQSELVPAALHQQLQNLSPIVTVGIFFRLRVGRTADDDGLSGSGILRVKRGMPAAGSLLARCWRA